MRTTGASGVMAGSSKRVSQSEFARRQGWSRQYVGKLVKSGKITLVNGKIDTEQALSAIKAQSEPATELRAKPRGETVMGVVLLLRRRLVD